MLKFLKTLLFRLGPYLLIAAAGVLIFSVSAGVSLAGVIDAVYKYAWGENIGWLNFGATEGNVQVTSAALSGYIWSDTIGWISLNCSNTTTCGSNNFYVANDGQGHLSGYAWGENVGWIQFNPTYGGVNIDPATGDFSGYAWGENIGWISFEPGNVIFSDNATTTYLSIVAGGVTAPSLLTVYGDYSNSGTFTANGGTVYIASTTAAQTLSGNMASTSAFSALTILNSYGSDAQTDPGVIFSAKATTTGLFSAITPNTKIRFPAGATSTFQSINFNGQAVGTRVSLRSSSAASQWGIEVPPGSRTVLNTDVKDSNACSGYADIDASDSSNQDSTNNLCWNFPIPPSPKIYLPSDYMYDVRVPDGGATTTIPEIKVKAVGSSQITSANDIRVRIDPNFPLIWNGVCGAAGSTTPTFGGTATSRVDATKTGFICQNGKPKDLYIDVTGDFLSGEDLLIPTSLQWGATSTAFAASTTITLSTDKGVGTAAVATGTIAVKGVVQLYETPGAHDPFDKFTTAQNLSQETLFAFTLIPYGEDASTTLNIGWAGQGVSQSDFTPNPPKIYYDANQNGIVDGAEYQIFGDGTVNLNGISFMSTSTVSSTVPRRFIMKADVAGLVAGDALGFWISTSSAPTSSVVSVGLTSRTYTSLLTATGTPSGSSHIADVITQRAYIFTNDDGSTVATGSPLAATNTPVTDVKIGQRMVLRYQMDNASTTEGLVGYWKMNEASSTFVNDYSGYGNNGSSSGNIAPAVVPGRFNNAFSFDGNPDTAFGDHIVVPDAPVLRISNNFTLSLWFKPSSTAQSNKYIIARNDAGGAHQYAIIYEYVNDQVEFYAVNYTGTDPRPGSQMTVADTNWHNIVYDYDGSTWQGYLDGVNIFSVSRTFSLDTTPLTGFYIGSSVASGYVAAFIDDVRLYNRALSANEIAALYQAELPLVTTNQFRLQYDKNDSNWRDLSTTTEIRTSLSTVSSGGGQKGGITGAGEPIPSPSVGPCTFAGASTTPYQAGRWYSMTATTSAMSLQPNTCSDVAFAIDTSGATPNTTYRFRLVDGSTGSPLPRSVATATITTETSQTISYSKGAYGTSTVFTIEDPANNVGKHPAVVLPPDGLPAIAYYDYTALSLKFVKCGTPNCIPGGGATNTIISLDDPGATDVGQYAAIAIGSDGLPIIAYNNNSNDTLKVYHCGTKNCIPVTGVATNTVTTISYPTTKGTGTYNSVGIAPDGFPLISSFECTFTDCGGVGGSGALWIVKCGTLDCVPSATGSATNTIVVIEDLNANNIGYFSNIAFAPDGLPAIVYKDGTALSLKYVKCGTAICAAAGSATNTITTIEDPGDENVGTSARLVMGPDGLPLISYRSSTAGALKIAKCGNVYCIPMAGATNTITSVDDPPGALGNTAIAIGADGLPATPYNYIEGASLKFLHCGNAACDNTFGHPGATNTIVSIDSPGDTNINSHTMVIGSDGMPMIAYNDYTAGSLKFAKCGNIYCDNTLGAGNFQNWLPDATNSPLQYRFDATGYSNVADDDGRYETISGSGARLAQQFEYVNANNTDEISVSWNGRVDENKQVDLQFYRFGSTNAWQTATSVASPVLNSDFTMAYNQTSNLSEYYQSGTNKVFARVMMATTSSATTSSLKTDQFAPKFGKQINMDSDYSQMFTVNDTNLISIAPITITTYANQKATSSTGLRIRIPSTLAMEWDTTDSSGSCAGNASSKVGCSSITYSTDKKTMYLPVVTDFSAGDSVQIGGLSFKNFTVVSSAPARLELYTGGADDTAVDATDGKVKVITGAPSGGVGLGAGGEPPGFQFGNKGGTSARGGIENLIEAPVFQQSQPPTGGQGGSGGTTPSD